MTRTSSSLWSFCCCFSLCLCCCCCCCCCNELCCLGLDGTDMSQGKMAVSPLWYWTLPVTIDESGNKRQQNFILFVLIWFNYMSCCWYDGTATIIWGQQSVTVWHWSCTWGAYSRSQTDCKPAKTGNPFVIPNPAQHMHRRAQHRNILTSKESGENSSRLPSSLSSVGRITKSTATHISSHSFKFNCVGEA